MVKYDETNGERPVVTEKTIEMQEFLLYNP